MRSIKLLLHVAILIAAGVQASVWAYYECNGNLPAGQSRYCTCIYIVEREPSTGTVSGVGALFGCMESSTETSWSCNVCGDCPEADFWNHITLDIHLPVNCVGPVATQE